MLSYNLRLQIMHSLKVDFVSSLYRTESFTVSIWKWNMNICLAIFNKTWPLMNVILDASLRWKKRPRFPHMACSSMMAQEYIAETRLCRGVYRQLPAREEHSNLNLQSSFAIHRYECWFSTHHISHRQHQEIAMTTKLGCSMMKYIILGYVSSSCGRNNPSYFPILHVRHVYWSVSTVAQARLLVEPIQPPAASVRARVNDLIGFLVLRFGARVSTRRITVLDCKCNEE